jgi:hypothetical protein
VRIGCAFFASRMILLSVLCASAVQALPSSLSSVFSRQFSVSSVFRFWGPRRAPQYAHRIKIAPVV